jgi:hypothetical protein
MRGKRAKMLRKAARFMLELQSKTNHIPEKEYEQVKTGRYTIDINTGALKEQTMTRLTPNCVRHHYQFLKAHE